MPRLDATRLKDALARAVVRVAPSIRERVPPERAHPLAAPRSFAERLMARALHGAAARRRDDHALEGVHEAYWRSGEGAQWHEDVGDRLSTIFGPRCTEMLDRVVEVARRPDIVHLCEIGTGRGAALSYLAERAPGLRTYVGLDLSEARIERSREAHRAEPLRFEAARGQDWLRERAEPGILVVTFGGVLEYFAPDELAAMFADAATRLRPAAFALFEPISDDQALDALGSSAPYGVELSFSHPYPAMLQAAGFQVDFLRELRLDGLRMVEVIASAT